MSTNIRRSNFELLRIISMLFIVIYHVIYHGKIIQNCTNQGIELFFTLIEFFIIIHVNLFVLITGYFQSKSSFKQSKIWSLINASLFYKLIIVIILTTLCYISLSKLSILKELFILNLDEYWFVKLYIFLYCLSPFINKFIEKLDKNTYRKFLLVSLIIFSIIPYLTGNQAFSNDGYSLYNFVLLYCIGGYMRIYPIEKNYIFKRCSKNLLRIILFLIFITCPIINYLLYRTSFSLLNINSVLNELSNNIISMRIAYSNPLILLQSVSFFLLFETFDIKSKVINNISKLTIGIYLIHDNNFVREYLYKFIGIDRPNISSYSFIFYVFVMAVLIFVVCGLIEWIRQLIFKFIYNRRLSKRIRDKYYNWIHSIRIENTN